MKRKLKTTPSARIIWTGDSFDEAVRRWQESPQFKRQAKADHIIKDWFANPKRMMGDGGREFRRLLREAARGDYMFTQEEARAILPLLLDVNERIASLNEWRESVNKKLCSSDGSAGA